MAKDLNPPRGMRDFLASEKAHRERVLATIVDTYRRHGFTQIETPVMENIERLTAGMGGDNEKLAFRVMRRGLGADDLARAAADGDASELADLGLRYDLTVPLARFYGTHRAELPRVFKSIQIAPVWRAERPQKGRYRQFVQCDIDIIGEPSSLAEMELILASGEALEALGLGDAFLRVNDRRLLDALVAACGFPADSGPRVLISVDKLDKIGVDGVVAELGELGFAEPAGRLEGFLRGFVQDGPFPVTAEAIRGALPGLGEGDDSAAAAIDSLAGIAAALEGLPHAPRLVFDPTLVRGMGYYTGTIFEIALPEGGSSVGGGGRYDRMIGRFLGQDAPACGISIGFERIVDLVPRDDAEDDRAVALLYDRPDQPNLLAIKTALVAEGYRVRLAKRGRKIQGVLAELAAEGFARFAFVPESATSSGELEFKRV